MIPPTDRSSSQADFAILQQTHREAHRSVRRQNNEKSMISTVRAWSRQSLKLARQAEYVIFLQTRGRSHRSVPSRNNGKLIISIVRAWPRQTITRRGKPISRASYKPIERSTVPCRVEITRKHAFPQCVHDSPTAQSSSPADFVVPLHTQAEAQGSVPGRHEGKRGYAIVRAGSRQPTNRRGKPILPSSCRPTERPTVPSAGEPMRNR